MVDKSKNYNLMKQLVYAWDNGEVDYINLKDRILKKYGRQYIIDKLSFVNGKFEDLTYEPRFQHLLEKALMKERYVDHSHDGDKNVYTMKVPEDEYQQWLYSTSSPEIKEFQKKKAILDKYLNTFSKHDKNRLIRIMVINTENPSYVSFLDLNPNLMTSQQYLIYKDIIKFYELEEYQNLLKDRELWLHFNERMESFIDGKLYDRKKSSSSFDLNIDNGAGNIEGILESERKLEDSIQANKELTNELTEEGKEAEQIIRQANQSNIIEQLDQSRAKDDSDEIELDNPMKEKLEELSNQLTRQRILAENILKQQEIDKQYKVNDVNRFYDRRIKPLVFNHQTTVVNANNIFGYNNDYLPSHSQNIIPRAITLSDPTIKKVGYVDNIADLILVRDKIMLSNNQLVNEIIEKQIMYNNQFVNDAQYSNLLNSNYVNSPIFDNRQMQDNQRFYQEQSRVLEEQKRLMNEQFNAIPEEIDPRQNYVSHQVNNGIIRPRVVIKPLNNGYDNSAMNSNFVNNNAINTNSMYNLSNNMDQSLQLKPQQMYDENEKQSLSSVLGNNWRVNKVEKPIENQQELVASNVVTYQPNKLNIKNIQGSDSKTSKSTPVNGIRPYKPNTANAIRKVNIPTKSFNKSELEPTMNNKNKIINGLNKQVSTNQEIRNRNNQITKEIEIEKETVTIPSKKII